MVDLQADQGRLNENRPRGEAKRPRLVANERRLNAKGGWRLTNGVCSLVAGGWRRRVEANRRRLEACGRRVCGRRLLQGRTSHWWLQGLTSVSVMLCFGA